MNKAIVLLSGGLDSATTLYIAQSAGYKTYCLIFDYNQRHIREIESAMKLAQASGSEHRAVKIDFPWKGSALLDNDLAVPRLRENIPDEIPITYVPSRNTIFLGFAMSWAEAIGAKAIFIGANAIDYSGYPDCRPEYFEYISGLFKIGTKAGVMGNEILIKAPLINKTKSEIIMIGTKLGVPFELTWSCYNGGLRPCGECDSCLIRARGFKEAGIKDLSLEVHLSWIE